MPFYEDYEFISNSGTLDYYNGRFAVTPEYPCGTYAYYATMDTEGNSLFPYFIGLAFYGEVLECVTGGGPGGPGDPPPCDQVPAGMPCCGDGICGGPETAANCPSDCSPLKTSATPDPCDLAADAVLYAQSPNQPTCNPTVGAGLDVQLGCDASITLNGSGNTGTGVAYSYEWCAFNGGNIVSGGNTLNPVVDATGTYVLTVTDENGFYVFDEVNVTGGGSGLNVSFTGLPANTSTNTPITLTGVPAGGTFTGPGIAFSAFNPSLSGPGIHTITYTYEDANGCSGSYSQDIFVFNITYVFVNYNLGTIAPKLLDLTIESLSNQYEYNVEIFNIEGKLQQQQKLFPNHANHNSFQINIEKLQKGFYLIKVDDGLSAVSKTFVKY